MLIELTRVAPEHTEPWAYAHRELARVLAETDPWRASICARRAVHTNARDAEAWALLGLTQSLLDNHEYAVRAYRRALALEPGNPWYAHNLGHLLDVVFDDLEAATPWLERAVRHLALWPGVHPRDRSEIVASLAHCLLRQGAVAAARERILPVIQSGFATELHHQLYTLIRTQHDAQLDHAMNALPPRPSARLRRARRHTTP
jgi:Flp pilus assembly protein TadD